MDFDWPASLPHDAAALVFGYLLGSIPFGLIITRIAGTADIRGIGSGNIGATNVLRTGRKELAAATLLCDLLKGTVAVLAAQQLFGSAPALAAGLGAFLGHVFPIWLRFKGGKGVATYIGVLIAFSVLAALIYGIVWLTIAAITRYSSLSALTASATAPIVLWLLERPRPALLLLVLTILVFITHRANIARLRAGTETRIGKPAVPR